MASPPSQQTLSVQDALGRAYGHWNAGQADQAEQWCQRVLAAWPGQADAMHLLGLMAHAYGNLDLAISHLRQACMAPRAPAVYSSNLAEMYRQKGMLAEGEEAAQRAVSMDPSLVSAWSNLGILLQESGKLERSLECLQRVVALTPEAPETHNNLGNTWRLLNRLDQAEPSYRKALELNPSYAEAHSNLAFLLSSQGRYDNAYAHAQRAIELSPRLIDAYLNLAEVEMSRERYSEVLRALDMLNAFAPQHPAALSARAKALKQLERAEEALPFARRAVALMPRSADAHSTLASVLAHLGQTEEALASAERAAKLPGTKAEEATVSRGTMLLEAGRKEEALTAFEEALVVFPNSMQIRIARIEARSVESGDDADIAALEGCVAEGDRRTQSDLLSARFALGKAYLDIKNPERAFHHLNIGNRTKRTAIQFDARQTERWMMDVLDACSPERMATLSGLGTPGSMPIFIVGMPRSGTTLIEQILSSHPQVTGAGELAALRLTVESAGAFPASLRSLTRESASVLLPKMGQDYLKRVAPLAQGRPYLVDKMPGNFLYAGLIPLILPGARIIHSRRDAVDTCLSCYTKLFGGSQPFAYDLAELGIFYRLYERMMDHWRKVLPADSLIEVDYEAVVDDIETEARRMIEFLGLPWDDACLEFHKNRRVVRTASVNQVRQPIYKSSKGRWTAYASYLEPLLAELGISKQ
ncbi:tetratricopeptide repeat-containing sulfotransferase family protein [Paraburkholderia sp. DHOC27]|uniref:tetratricopeptide repeat-containing sulfotransferase family protein n=1 Tax=Paraburkholderia sp. DHOC27 TaxID=2303330 RepID=UPI000E3B7C46|nr:tetratricopeptide repeat-containing sulfotransferase family protein [Paraburkholderia sp. DHOC27]RFU44555.1 sulfotransferase family protein [Paraburkholderia sp. DHOC27]